MTYSESPFSQLSDELWHVFGGRRRFPTTRAVLAAWCLGNCVERTGAGETRSGRASVDGPGFRWNGTANI